MTSATGRAPVREAEAAGEEVARSDKFEWLARAGLVARGVVYGIVGVLAVKVAFGSGGKTTDQQGALKTMAGEPFGKVLLVVLALGLAGYAIWRLVRAGIGHGPETGEDETKDRISGVVSGIAYAALCFTAVKILVGASSSSSSSKTEKATAGVLGWPGGRYLAILAGLVVIGVAVDQAWKGISEKFLDDTKTERMSRRTREGFVILGIAGHVARAIVFALIGWFVVKAAIDYDPDKAVGLDQALAKLASGSGGQAILGIVALGLLAFAAYSIVDSRYRRV
jgi:uncharacterized protein DUF1206